MQVQFQGIVSNAFLKPEDPVFFREGFNQNGDVISHLNRPSTVDLTGKHLFTTPVTFDPESIRVLEDFDAFARHQNVQVIFMFPPLPDSAFAENNQHVRQVCDGITRTSLDVLGDPADLAFPVDYFFDTLYHLNARGRAARTEIFLRDLELLKSSRSVPLDCTHALDQAESPPSLISSSPR